MTRTIAKWLTCLSYVVMVVLAFVFKMEATALVWIAAVEIAVLLILSRYLRCPNCGKNQGKGQFFAEYCPHCGAHLDDW